MCCLDPFPPSNTCTPVKTTEEAQAVRGRDLFIAARCGLLGLKKQIPTSVCRGRGGRTPFLSAVETPAKAGDPLYRQNRLPTRPPWKAGGEQLPAPPQGVGGCARAGRAGQQHLEGGLCPPVPCAALHSLGCCFPLRAERSMFHSHLRKKGWGEGVKVGGFINLI